MYPTEELPIFNERDDGNVLNQLHVLGNLFVTALSMYQLLDKTYDAYIYIKLDVL